MTQLKTAARETAAVFTENKLTLATAESCTGGMIGEAITSVAGVSAVYLGGVISYANSVKTGVLGVSADTLMHYGAVSVQTAKEMADGVRRLTGADVAVSVTGIAGPDGGTAEKPVGTVCFGVSAKDGTMAVRVQFPSKFSREEIRTAAAAHALALARARAEDIAGGR